jgi:hypothetical protein
MAGVLEWVVVDVTKKYLLENRCGKKKGGSPTHPGRCGKEKDRQRERSHAQIRRPPRTGKRGTGAGTTNKKGTQKKKAAGETPQAQTNTMVMKTNKKRTGANTTSAQAPDKMEGRARATPKKRRRDTCGSRNHWKVNPSPSFEP